MNGGATRYFENYICPFCHKNYRHCRNTYCPESHGHSMIGLENPLRDGYEKAARLKYREKGCKGPRGTFFYISRHTDAVYCSFCFRVVGNLRLHATLREEIWRHLARCAQAKRWLRQVDLQPPENSTSDGAESIP